MSPKTRFDITACSASSGIADMAGRDINEQKPRTSAVSLLWLANDAVSRGARYGLLCYFAQNGECRQGCRFIAPWTKSSCLFEISTFSFHNTCVAPPR